MPELDDHGIDLPTLRRMYGDWQAGTPKSALERRYLRKGESHGKLFSSLVRQHLGIETEKRSHQSEELDRLRADNDRLRSLLRLHGIDPGG